MTHEHAHGDDHPHRSLWLAPPASRQGVHRVGRRRFLVDLGRNAFAIAVVGGFVAACSDDDGSSVEPTDASSEMTDVAVGEAPAPTHSAGDQLRWAQADLGFVSAYVLVRGREAAVVDTGGSGSTRQIGEALATVGASFDDVRHVVLTHSHGDHVGSLPAVLGEAPDAVAYAGAEDIPNISSPGEIVAVGDGDDVLGLQVIATPGHTPGSISLLDPGIGLLVAGDALNGNEAGSEVLGPNERFSSDMAAAAASVRKLAGREIEIVAPGHGQPVDTEPGSGFDAVLQQLAADGLLEPAGSSDG